MPSSSAGRTQASLYSLLMMGWVSQRLPLDAEQQLGRAAHLHGHVAGVPRVGGQRKAVSPRPGDGDVILGFVHLVLHGVQGVEPAGVAGVLPAQALHGADDSQRSEFRQDVGPGKICSRFLYWRRIVSGTGVRPARACPASAAPPRVGVVIRLQRAQFGELCAPATADDLPFRPDIPQRQQVGAVGAGYVQFAEAAQRIVVGRNTPDKSRTSRRTVSLKSRPPCAQKLGHGAHLGRAAAAEQKRLGRCAGVRRPGRCPAAPSAPARRGTSSQARAL